MQSSRPLINSVEKARILLVGQVGSGKSSFFNSINSVFRGNVTGQAITGIAGTSLSTQVLYDVYLCMLVGLFLQNTNFQTQHGIVLDHFNVEYVTELCSSITVV